MGSGFTRLTVYKRNTAGSSSGSTGAGQRLTFQIGSFRLDMKKCPTMSVLRQKIKLLREVVKLRSLKAYKCRIDEYLSGVV